MDLLCLEPSIHHSVFACTGSKTLEAPGCAFSPSPHPWVPQV